MKKIALRIVLLAFLVLGVAACGAFQRDGEATPEPSPTSTPVPTEYPMRSTSMSWAIRRL